MQRRAPPLPRGLRASFDGGYKQLGEEQAAECEVEKKWASVLVLARECARGFKEVVSPAPAKGMTCSHIYTQHPTKKKREASEGGRNAWTWIDNILFTHASAHRDLCSYSLSLSSLYNVVLAKSNKKVMTSKISLQYICL